MVTSIGATVVLLELPRTDPDWLALPEYSTPGYNQRQLGPAVEAPPYGPDPMVAPY